MRVLITGITGFVGGHLVERLLSGGRHTIAGISRRGEWPHDLAHLSGSVRLQSVDLLQREATEALLADVRPDWIFHLAGYANTGKSFHEPDECWRDNLDATRVFFDAIVRTKLSPRVLFVSTGLIYGEPDDAGQACDERTTLKPASPYAASKAAADLLSYQYSRTAGVDIVRARLFNQIGPRQSADYAVANFAHQIAAAEKGQQKPVIETGDLSAHRDVTDVRDMADALIAVMEKGAKGEVYNAGRGETFRIQDLLDRLVKLAKVKVESRSSPDIGRKADTTVTRANTAKLRNTTGWSPKFTLEQTLSDTLDYWRTRGETS
jgi:GDP-4-dehydro-6-deoxy-D-mannose reductase